MAPWRFEPMTVGRILDRAFRLYRENFLRYVTIAAVVQVPAGLLVVAGTGIMYSNFTNVARTNQVPEDVVTMMVGAMTMMSGGFLAFVSFVLAIAAMARSMSASCLGGDLGAVQAYRSLMPRAGWLFLMVLLVMPSLFVVYIALVVVMVVIVVLGIAEGAAGLGPVVMVTSIGLVTLVAIAACGVLLLAWTVVFCLSVQAVALEDLNTFEAIARSVKLVRGNLRKCLGSALLTFLLVGIPIVAASSLGFVLAFAVFGYTNMMAMQVIQQSVSLFMQVLVMPIWAAAMLLLYYDLRIRKEGYDLELLAGSLRPAEAAHGASR